MEVSLHLLVLTLDKTQTSTSWYVTLPYLPTIVWINNTNIMCDKLHSRCYAALRFESVYIYILIQHMLFLSLNPVIVGRIHGLRSPTVFAASGWLHFIQ
jgi:hypothetical protein